MVKHSSLIRNPRVYEDFFCHQAGTGFPVFVGGRGQVGRGLGSFFSGFGRMILPWIKTGGKALLKEGLGTGLQVASDALAGRNVGESFRERARESGQRLLSGAVNHLTQSGSGLRKRRHAPPGVPAKRIKRAPKTRKVQSSRKKSQKKRQSDIFG